MAVHRLRRIAGHAEPFSRYARGRRTTGSDRIILVFPLAIILAFLFHRPAWVFLTDAAAWVAAGCIRVGMLISGYRESLRERTEDVER